MSQIVLEAPDELYEACLQIAKRTGRPVEWCIIETLARHNPYASPELTPEQMQQSLDELARFIGIAESGNPRSADNEAIDGVRVRLRNIYQHLNPQLVSSSLKK